MTIDGVVVYNDSKDVGRVLSRWFNPLQVNKVVDQNEQDLGNGPDA